MKNTLFWLSAILIFVFWPLSFVIANRDSWISFAFATLVILVGWILYQKKFKYHYLPYLVLPVIHPALLFFPIVMFLFYLKGMPLKVMFSCGTILFVILIFTWKSFFAYSIFTPDPLANDTLVKKITLIPNRQLARIFENKTTIPVDKLKTNIFQSLDFNNYFFGFHPQEIGGNQNLTKFSFLTIVPFLFGLFCIIENIHKKWLLAILFSAILSIGLINNQDRFDSLLFIPISLICFFGLKKITYQNNQYLSWIFPTIFIPISLLEIVRILL